MQEAGARADRIWVVVGRNHVSTDGVDEALSVLEPTHDLVETETFNGDVEVLLFERQA